MNTYETTKGKGAPTRRVAAMLVATLGCMSLTSLLVFLAISAPASAHNDTGIIKVASHVKNDDGTTSFEISIVFDGDGDPAPDAAVTIIAEHPNALKIGPVRMTPVKESPGRYAATIALTEPGEWQLRFTSLTPKAYLETTFTVEPEPTTTTGPESVSRPPTTFRATSVETFPATSPPSSATPQTTANSPGPRGQNTGRNLGFAAVGLVGLAAVLWLLQRSRKS